MTIKEMDVAVTLEQAVYNPETGGFQATARIREGGAAFTYRVTLPAAPHAEFANVTTGLKARAVAQHAEARDRTQRMLRDTLRAVTRRANSPTLGAFLAA
ncbi:MAG: hypothetical protein AAFZ04_14720 [Pseudomonadota bacterium]